MDTEGNGRIRLLHVDDHTTVVTPLSSRLEALGGYQVTVERDADAAIATLEEAPYDCVLLADTVESTSAREFCRRVRAAGLDCPILVLTNDPASAVADGILDAGATDVVDAASDAFLEVLRQRVRLVADTDGDDGGNGAAPSIERLVADLPLGVFVEDETLSYANDAFLDLLAVEDRLGDRSLAELLGVSPAAGTAATTGRTDGSGAADGGSTADVADPQLVTPARDADDVGTLALWTDAATSREGDATVGAVWDLDAGTGLLGEFRRRHAMLESVLGSLPLATSFRDAYGRYVAVSEQVTELGPGPAMTAPDGTVHHAPADVVGKTDHDLYPTALADARLEEHEQVTETERPVSDGGGTFSVGGEEVTLATVVAPWYDADDNVVGTVDVTMDVTDRARSEHEATVQREVFDVVGDALAIELRDAVDRLGRVRGPAPEHGAVDGADGDAVDRADDEAVDGGRTDRGSAAGGHEPDDGTRRSDADGGPGHPDADRDVADPLDHVRSIADDLAAIVDTVRTACVDLEPTELDAAARAAWRSLACAEDAQCTLEVETEAVVLAEPEALEQLLAATLENAVESGAETVHVGTRDLGFFVADDGPGIAPDERDRALEYGYTTKPDAVGSGLTVAALVATAHEWELSIADSAAGGTRIEVDDVRFR